MYMYINICHVTTCTCTIASNNICMHAQYSTVHVHVLYLSLQLQIHVLYVCTVCDKKSSHFVFLNEYTKKLTIVFYSLHIDFV